MMRPYKFRGKALIDSDYCDIEKGNWVYGGAYLDGYILNEITEATDEYIAIGDWFPVDPETVGMWTGLEDKNGKEIYEGDIVRIENDITETQSLGSIENKDLSVWEELVETFEVEDVVVFVNGSFDVQGRAVGIFMPYEIEVIGNIYDKEE